MVKMAAWLVGILDHFLSRLLPVRVIHKSRYAQLTAMERRADGPAAAHPGMGPGSQRFQLPAVDYAAAEASLREYAAGQGDRVDALVAGAAAHFRADRIERRTGALSSDELERLIEDEKVAPAR